MQLIERPNTVESAGIKNTVSFGIKQEGLAHVFGVLRNQLYSDPILAVIREYCTNAVDAHTEAGIPERPIEVSLPTSMSMVFKVRDFGLSLTDEDISDVYAFYGESTKRSSNALIGQLGIGSKSAFAYGDNFVIVAYVDGIKSTYNAFIDASQIGQIAKLASEPTTEPNGVEISIGVREADIPTFVSKAYKLFRYFKVRPIVTGADFKYEDAKAIMSGADWRVLGKSSTSIAIMGNIGYPLEQHWTDEKIVAALQCGIEIDFAIGDLEISASREKLQYTDRTKKTIYDKLTRIVAEVEKGLNDRFSSCATMFDACRMYGEVMDLSSELYALLGMVRSCLTYAGKRITSDTLHTDSCYVRQYEQNWRNKQIKSIIVNKIPCKANTMLVDNDLGITTGIVNRIYNPLILDGKNVYVVSCPTDAAKQALLAETGLVESNFVKLSSLTKITLASVGAGSINPKHQSKEFVFNEQFNPSSYKHHKWSDYWNAETLDVANDSGVYVQLDKFKSRNRAGGVDKPTELKKIVKSLRAFGIAVPKIYGFKAAVMDEVNSNPNMVSLWDYVAEQFTEFFAKNNVAQKLANRLSYDDHSDNQWQDILERVGPTVDKQDGVFAKVAQTFLYMKHTADKAMLDEAAQWREYFTATDKPEHDLKAQVNAVRTAYPLFQDIRYWDGSGLANRIKDYVNLVDKG